MRRVAITSSNLTTAQLNGTDSVVHGPGCLTWHSALETTGTATAQYNLFDGGTANGVFLAYISLSAGQSTRDSAVLHAIPFKESLHVKVVSGTISFVLLAWVDHDCEQVLDWDHRQRKIAELAALDSIGRAVG